MAVAYDAASESHTGTTPSTSEASFSWTHTPAGTPRGVLVYTVCGFGSASGDTEQVTGVTYGGAALSAVSGGSATDTAGEPARCTAWFLGSSIPAGNQTVQVTRNNNTEAVYAMCATVTAGGNTSVYTSGIVLVQESGTFSEQNVDDGSPATGASVRFCGMFSGLATPINVGANSTVPTGIGIDTGAANAQFCYETVAGNGSRPVGFDGSAQGPANDDRACVHLAVYQSSTDAGPLTASVFELNAYSTF